MRDAQAFFDELRFMLARQIAAPNSPQWFNTGLHWAYGIDCPSKGHYYVEPETNALVESTSSYERPQPHACFIQSVADDLLNDGGIMDLWMREARLFKYGSGTGSNFSKLRGENEKLSNGGKSSGLLSFLKIGDRAANATSRPITPTSKLLSTGKEEQKVAALVTGSKIIKKAHIFRELAVSYLGRSDLAHVDPAVTGLDVMGDATRAFALRQTPAAAEKLVSRGFVRAKVDALTVFAGAASAQAIAIEPDAEAKIGNGLDHLQWTKPSDHRTIAGKRAEARQKGYTGDECPECGNFAIVRTGKCARCECGYSTGCS